jgi:TolB protein
MMRNRDRLASESNEPARRRRARRRLTLGGQVILSLVWGVGVLAVGYAQAGGGSSAGRAEDGGYAVFVSRRTGAAELYLLELETRQVTQLTQTGRAHHTPAVAQGARSLVFAAQQGAGFELYEARWGAQLRTRRPTLVGLTRLTINVMDEFAPSITADGQWIAFSSGLGIEVMSTAEGSARHLLLPTVGAHRDFAPAISPDGREIAFVSDRSGAPELWIYDWGSRRSRQVTTGLSVLGGVAWRADSRQLVVTTGATASGRTGIALVDPVSGSYQIVTEEEDRNASFSATGDRVLFSSTRDGDAELYLLTLATGKTQRLTVSPGFDDNPVFLAPLPTLPGRVTPR